VVDAPDSNVTPNSTYVYRTFEHDPEEIGGSGGEFRRIDSHNFPISKTIAATFVTLKPGALRELHWHPNVSSSFSLILRDYALVLINLTPGRGMALFPSRQGSGYRLHW
jgi:hypothetical protein